MTIQKIDFDHKKSLFELGGNPRVTPTPRARVAHLVVATLVALPGIALVLTLPSLWFSDPVLALVEDAVSIISNCAIGWVIGDRLAQYYTYAQIQVASTAMLYSFLEHYEATGEWVRFNEWVVSSDDRFTDAMHGYPVPPVPENFMSDEDLSELIDGFDE